MTAELQALDTRFEPDDTYGPDEETDEEQSVDADLAFQEGAARSWGHLMLLEKIGTGAYAEVYRGYDIRLDIEVAVKLLTPRPGENVLFRLLHEARALARVRDQHVVSVHGASVHGGRAGLWMDLVRGGTLGERLRTRGPLAAAEATRIGRQLCTALGAVHDAGVVHADIKAENVMQEPGGRLVLMDFGASQLADGPHQDAGSAGTPLYSAPEVLNGERPTIQSDIYALGVLLYHLVTGTYPVNASSLEGLKAEHAAGAHHALRDARPDLPAGFIAIVDRALEPDPDDRYRTMREMEKALTPSRRRVPSVLRIVTPPRPAVHCDGFRLGQRPRRARPITGYEDSSHVHAGAHGRHRLPARLS